MVVLDLRNYRSTINEIDLQKDPKKCSSDCYFKYEYPASSQTYHGCIDDSLNNEIKIPNITITNQTFCEASHSPSVIFSNTKYWFDKMFITNKNDYLFNYTNDFNKASGTDSSMCACMLLHKDEYSKNFLLVYVPVIASNNMTQQTSTGTAGEIISNIVNDVSSADCTANTSNCALGPLLSSQPSKQIDLNKLIISQKFYYTKNGNINFVIYSGIDPIYITEALMKKIDSYLPSTLSETRNRNHSLSTIVDRIFISDSAPINSLTAQEDEIYIKCQPTDEEGELLDTGVSKVPLSDESPFGAAFKNLQTNKFFNNNQVIAMIIGIVLMIVLIKGAEYLFKAGSKTFLDNL